MKIWIAYDSNMAGPSQCDIENEKNFIIDEFAPCGITFNFCEEIIVDDNIASDPASFLTNTTYRDPNSFDILLFSPSPVATGEACSVGSDCGIAQIGGTAVHELGHMFNLFHTFEGGGCIRQFPGFNPFTNAFTWNPGDPYSTDDKGDMVADTPLHPQVIDYPLPPASPNDCFISWGTTNDGCNEFGTFPSNYSQNANGVQEQILELNHMSYLTGPGFCGDTQFTTGQCERMVDFLATNFPENQGVPVACTNNNNSINNSINNSSVPITGLVMLDSDLTITSNVTFENANIVVFNNAKIVVNPGGTLNTNLVRFMSGCTGWTGIDAKSGSILNMQATHIQNASIGLTLENNSASELNLTNVKFIECEMGIFATNGGGNLPILTDNAFLNSPVHLVDFDIKLNGCIFSGSDLNVDGGSVFIGIENSGRPQFLNSSNVIFDGSYLGYNYAYIDRSSTINVINSTNFQLCWSSLSCLNSPYDAKVNIFSADTYNVWGNIFQLGPDDIYIHSTVAGSKGSYVGNNIFFGGKADFVSESDPSVEISCNYHNNTETSYTTPSGFQDQGRPLHPAGNIFNTGPTIVDIVPASPFEYFYNIGNQNDEKPKLDNTNDLFLADIVSERVNCKTRDEIFDAGDWDTFFQVYCPVTGLPYDPAVFCGCPPPPPPPPIVYINEDPECIGCGPVSPGTPVVTTGARNHNTNQEFESTQNVQNMENASVEVGVNTTTNNVTIRQVAKMELRLNLYNVTGQSIIAKATRSNDYDLSLQSLPQGVYILVITDTTNQIIKNQVIFNTK